MRSTKAFTFVEIMIVMVIIGLLAAMAIPAIQKVRYSTVEKAVKRGEATPEQRLWYYKHHWTVEKRKKAQEDSRVLDQDSVINVSEPGLIQKLEIDGKTFVLVPKVEARETEIAGKVYWLVPVPK